MVSQVYSIYDPLGLMTSITIKFKILLQNLTVMAAGWDDEIETELSEKCRAMLKEMVMSQDIEFPRSIKPGGIVGQLEQVGFWDGGNPVSAGCVYGQYELADTMFWGYQVCSPCQQRRLYRDLKLPSCVKKEKIGHTIRKH